MLVSLALFQNYESGGLIYMLANNETEQFQQYLATYKTFEMYLVVLGLVLVEVIVGVNDFGQIGYGGPCPPNKKHTYRFLLYALDTKLNLPRNATRYDVERLIPQYLIESASFFVSYEQSWFYEWDDFFELHNLNKQKL